MTTLRHDIVTPNLVTLTEEIVKYTNDGYVMADGYPHNLMWNYVAVLTKEVDEPVTTEVAPKPVGRPKGSTK